MVSAQYVPSAMHSKTSRLDNIRRFSDHFNGSEMIYYFAYLVLGKASLLTEPNRSQVAQYEDLQSEHSVSVFSEHLPGLKKRISDSPANEFRNVISSFRFECVKSFDANGPPRICPSDCQIELSQTDSTCSISLALVKRHTSAIHFDMTSVKKGKIIDNMYTFV